MENKIAGLLGAVAALSTMGTAQATPAPAPDPMQANSYADLLEPIPNAAALLQAVDDQAPAKSAEANVQLAQYHHHHHHHHHHHGFYPRYGYGFGYGRGYRRYHHHHHHHHHHGYYRRGY